MPKRYPLSSACPQEMMIFDLLMLLGVFVLMSLGFMFGRLYERMVR
jgi:hypothetical protein